MSKKSPATIDVTEEELVACANTLNLVLNPPNKRLDGAGIRQFGLLVSLLQKLIKQVYDRPLL